MRFRPEADGRPFNTGNETFGLQPAFKQLSAILTDAMFVSRRRALLRTAGEAGWFKTWSYEFDAGPRASEAHPAYLGCEFRLCRGRGRLGGFC